MLDQIPKLVGIDLETTGCSFSDRIVEIAVLVYQYGELKNTFVKRVNPGMPIPPASTQIHGITDEDVKDCPQFREYANIVLEFLEDAALFGYNIMFDFNVLSGELVRLNYPHLDPKRFTLLDPFSIWKRQDPKTLSHAYKTFCGKELNQAHSALADISATFEVLTAQLAKYTDLPSTPKELGQYCYSPNPDWVCSTYHFIWNDKGEIVCNFGKNKGLTLKTLLKEQKSFCDWILNKDFPEDVKALVANALDGKSLPSRQETVVR